MSSLRRVVVVSRRPSIHGLAHEVAREVFAADEPSEAAEIIAAVAPDLVVFDGAVAPGQVRGHLERLSRDGGPACPTVALLARDDPFSQAQYRQAGVAECLVGEENFAGLRDLAARLTRPVARDAGSAPRDPGHYFLDETAAAVALAGHSPAIRKTLDLIRLVAPSQCNPVLVVGDTGTGKEVAARALHHLRHPDAPFVAVNCAALTANLLESELFGHVKGSFTGADRDKTGLLETAGAGTLFLDEISEMPLELQAKLLRVVQEKTFRKVGGVRDLECRATLIASSNRDLKQEVREKRFRQDLYYRLHICPIQLPPLRSPERRTDIPLLATYFLQTSNICKHRPKQVTAITQLALEVLSRHHWPGNVRELRNVIERAILLETTDKIGLSSILIDPLDEDREASFVKGPPNAVFCVGDATRDASDAPLHASRFTRDASRFSLEKAERELIARALHETGWQKTQAAALLGITRATLYAKVKQYDIRRQIGEGPQTRCVAFGDPAPWPDVIPAPAGTRDPDREVLAGVAR